VSFVHPIDFRYGSEVMRGVFSQENRLGLMLRVEVQMKGYPLPRFLPWI